MGRLVGLTAEGKIVAFLTESPSSYTALRRATGLSDRWLSKKLKELARDEIIDVRNGEYRLRDMKWSAEDPLFAEYLRQRATHLAKAGMMAEQLGSDPRVISIILFGSAAKGRSTGESDIDLLIITEGEVERDVTERIYELMFLYDVPVEAVVLTYHEFLTHICNETSLLFGVMEGYKVLCDRDSIGPIIRFIERKVKEEWAYDTEAQAWFQRRLLST